MSKAEFVRSFKRGTPASEVIAAGKKKGIKLTSAYIYVVRSKDRSKPVGVIRAPKPRRDDKVEVTVPQGMIFQGEEDAEKSLKASFDRIVKLYGTKWATKRLEELS